MVQALLEDGQVGVVEEANGHKLVHAGRVVLWRMENTTQYNTIQKRLLL